MSRHKEEKKRRKKDGEKNKKVDEKENEGKEEKKRKTKIPLLALSYLILLICIVLKKSEEK